MASRREQFAISHFSLNNKRVLDLGCGKGDSLRQFGPGSVGLDINPLPSPGLDIRPWNFMEGIPPCLEGQFDVVWASNILEHVLAPHAFLIDLRKALRPSGQVILVVPLTNGVPLSRWKGHLAADHINFFTPSTFVKTVEFAGYEISYAGAPFGSFSLGRLLHGILPTSLIAARPVPGFQYSHKAHKVLVDGQIVYKSGDTLVTKAAS